MKPSDLTYLLPELVLLAGAALVFLLDIVWLKRNTPAERRFNFLAAVALVALGAAALALIPSLGANVTVASMLTIDGFAVFIKALAIIGIALVILTAMPFMPARTAFAGEFYAFLLVTGLAVSLAASARNLVMVYLAMEFLSITSYVLAGYIRRDIRSGEAAIKYFLYGATASAVMLYGMSLLYGFTGTTDLAELARKLAVAPNPWLTAPSLILILAGLGFKASLVPFHQWAPDTYEGAPTPVTAFLSTVSKATGFAILVRVLLVGMAPVSGQWVELLVALAVLTMTLGNLTALRQTNIKRLIAYSSIAQAGYILIGLVAVVTDTSRTFTGINGVLIYLLAYLFTNLGIFAVITAVENATGKVEVSEYAGLARRSPWLAALLLIFLLSLTGIPPTAGFLGKFFVFGAAVQRQLWVLVAIAAINSVVAAFYYLNIVRVMFFTPSERTDDEPLVVKLPLQITLGITAVLTLLLGLLPGPVIEWASQSATTLLSALR